MKFYSGIGSRNAPQEILTLMVYIGKELALRGYTLRSGGSIGSDSAFENGCNLVNGKKEIYLPWKNFNSNDSPLHKVSEEAIKLASTIHPAWFACSHGAKLLHGRNCFQILGTNLDSPSKFVVCWTDTGGLKGGTATAMKLAIQHNIPVYNLFNKGAIQEIQDKYLL